MTYIDTDIYPSPTGLSSTHITTNWPDSSATRAQHQDRRGQGLSPVHAFLATTQEGLETARIVHLKKIVIFIVIKHVRENTLRI